MILSAISLLGQHLKRHSWNHSFFARYFQDKCQLTNLPPLVVLPAHVLDDFGLVLVLMHLHHMGGNLATSIMTVIAPIETAGEQVNLSSNWVGSRKLQSCQIKFENCYWLSLGGRKTFVSKLSRPVITNSMIAKFEKQTDKETQSTSKKKV